jgi:nicotinamidase/pyrazinamidase
MRPYFDRGAALIRIDIQNDFLPGGALAVPHGDEIVGPLNELSHHAVRGGCLVIDTQDWHPADHSSFASNHEGRAPFSMMWMPYGDQTLWPDHCVQGTWGSELSGHGNPHLDTTMTSLLIRKGMNPRIDSYSAFFENDRETPTGLGGCLKERGVTRLFLAGLAYDFCVGYSALDARRLGFEVVVLRDLCQSIDLDGSETQMTDRLLLAGVALGASDMVSYAK